MYVVRVVRIIASVALAVITFAEFGLVVTGIIAAVLLAANLLLVRWRRAHSA
jgi:hypothetical protein